jgi:hypothetical protein
VDGANALDVLAGVLWLMRDLMVPLALLLSVVGLFSRRDWAGAIVAWGLGFLGTIVVLADSDKHGLIGLPESLMIAALVGSAVLLLVGAKRHRSQPCAGYFRHPGQFECVVMEKDGSGPDSIRPGVFSRSVP